MNKTILASAVAVAGLTVAGVSFAAAAPAPMMTGMTNPWSVGVGVNYSAVQSDKATVSNSDYVKLNSRGWGGNIFAGYRINKYFGTELGLDMLGSNKYKYVDASDSTKNDSDAVKLQDQWNLHFVGQAFLPVNNWFSPYVFAGVGYINSELKVATTTTTTTKDNQAAFGFVYGAGLQFNFNQFGVRASYTRLDPSSTSSHDTFTVNGQQFTLPTTKDYISLDVLYRFGA
jgi:opacity protein-like surface antigen